ncbi:MAG: WXG100 family type VII secretion target, partial [Actinocrinis sp.]
MSVQDDTTTYPNLGFNPVPGVPADVESMSATIGQAVDSMQESGSLLDSMRDATSGVWQGDAGDAFREHFNGKLATDLQNAHTSLSTAVDVLKNWHGDLLGFKDTASKLDQAAADAKQAAQRADDAVKQAQANPDLKLVGQFFNTQQALQEAQSRIDQAESAARDAGNAAQNAHNELDDVFKRAMELASQHEEAARKYAQKLHD